MLIGLVKSFCIWMCHNLQLPFKNVQTGRCTNVLWKSVPGYWSSIRESSFSEFSPKPRQTVVCGYKSWQLLLQLFRRYDCRSQNWKNWSRDPKHAPLGVICHPKSRLWYNLCTKFDDSSFSHYRPKI